MQDAVFITYPDAVVKEGELPLKTLSRLDLSLFAATHVLPFFPSTSDRGFAITDFRSVDERFGCWADLPRPLMIDLVFNHTSASHPWFAQHPEYYLSVDAPVKTSLFRPRSSPLFTKINNKYYWSTFGPDQLDLNLYNASLREELDSIVDLYVRQGATLLRLDAVAYWYKDYHAISTPQTHRYIQSLIDKHPQVVFVVEANLDQEAIDSYTCYVHAYNFALAPLVLEALVFANLQPLVEHLNTPHKNYFNFLASHDGIGLSAVADRIDTRKLVTYTQGLGWSASDYELNINYFDALGGDARKMLLAHALLLSLRGIPGVYYHSYFGSRGVKSSVPRDANREQLVYDELLAALGEEDSERARIKAGIDALLKARIDYLSDQSQAASLEDGLLTLRRGEVTCLFNFSDTPRKLGVCVRDVVSDEDVRVLEPFGYAWVVE